MIVLAAVVLAFAGLSGEAPLDGEIQEQNGQALYERRWYFGVGATNFYPKLRESERKIDRQINNVFGWLPGWERPTTFADWRGRHYLWDLTVGAGRDLSPKLTLMFWTGGAKGTIKNKRRYGLLKTDIRFTRASIFFAPELYWYPWGKVEYERVAGKRGGDRARAALSGAKPYLSVASGYTWVRAEGEGKFRLPLPGAVIKQRESEDHHMITVSPRVGVEIPTGENAAVSALVIYSFFSPHGPEYDGPCISFNYRWRF
ncbi:MAG TPA: hypothetical protein ENN29_11665 [Candidatus Hydrogenedentes bacterium]|nr:hypothetical protein [Candidatus Hydrogenedentota bacterium]